MWGIYKGLEVQGWASASVGRTPRVSFGDSFLLFLGDARSGTQGLVHARKLLRH